jgi:hypothetical protein
MKPSDRPLYLPEHERVEQRLRDGREQAEKLAEKVVPPTGYLDTQLFPGKPNPAAYEKNYSFPDRKVTKTEEEPIQEEDG